MTDLKRRRQIIKANKHLQHEKTKENAFGRKSEDYNQGELFTTNNSDTVL